MQAKSVSPAVVVLLVILAAQTATAGPISPMYTTTGIGGPIYVVQGSAVVNSWAKHSRAETALAISGGFVRTAGSGDSAGSYLGSQYTLGGTFTGIKLAHCGGCVDSTTDGAWNYAGSRSGYGEVLRANLDWSNVDTLFAIGWENYVSGITYDPTNHSLWIIRGRGIELWLENRAMDGTLLSGFPLTAMYQGAYIAYGALAMDYADHTLWLASQIGYSAYLTLLQYSRSGQLLGLQSFPDVYFLAGGHMESPLPMGPGPVIPEPSTALLAAAGLAAVAFLRRRRR